MSVHLSSESKTHSSPGDFIDLPLEGPQDPIWSKLPQSGTALSPLIYTSCRLKLICLTDKWRYIQTLSSCSRSSHVSNLTTEQSKQWSVDVMRSFSLCGLAVTSQWWLARPWFRSLSCQHLPASNEVPPHVAWKPLQSHAHRQRSTDDQKSWPGAGESDLRRTNWNFKSRWMSLNYKLLLDSTSISMEW